MKKTKKLTVADKKIILLTSKNNALKSTINSMLDEIGEDAAWHYLLNCAIDEANVWEKEIASEQVFADENKTGAYALAGKEALQTIKKLKPTYKKALDKVKAIETLMD